MSNLPSNTRTWSYYTSIAFAALLFISITVENMGFKDFLSEQAFRSINSILGIALIASLIVLIFSIRNKMLEYYNKTTERMKDSNASKTLMAIVIIIFLIVSFFGTMMILGDVKCPACNVYKAIGFIIMMLWSCIFLCYFIWAIYYYNLNLGKTNEEWAKIKEAKKNRSKGLPYNPKDIEEEPAENPYKEETFGLPAGTVRGMIAFTLLFGAIAMLIVSFGMDNEVTPGSFFWDQFEFYKTAFLMMIAFYFGSRSLQYLTNKKGPVKVGGEGTEPQGGPSTGGIATQTSDTLQAPPKREIVVINPDAEKAPREKGTIPPIVATDPMAPKKKS